MLHKPVSSVDAQRAIARLAEINGVTFSEMQKRLDMCGAYAIETINNTPITTLSQDQWTSLVEFGYCVVDSRHHNRLSQYLAEGKHFFAHRNGLKGEFIVGVVAQHVFMGNDVYILKDTTLALRRAL